MSREPRRLRGFSFLGDTPERVEDVGVVPRDRPLQCHPGQARGPAPTVSLRFCGLGELWDADVGFGVDLAQGLGKGQRLCFLAVDDEDTAE